MKCQLFGVLLLFLFLASGCSKKADSSEKNVRKSEKKEFTKVQLTIPTQKDADQKELIPLIDEKELNDYPTWAQFLPPGVGAKGYINKPHKFPQGITPDRDVFLFEITGTEKQILWARLTAVPDVNTFLSVYTRGEQKIVHQDINGPDEEEIIVNLTLAPGKYYFKVGSTKRGNTYEYNLKKTYTLFWKLSRPGAGEEVEPNDRRTEANPVVIGSEIRGFISSGQDQDFFQLAEKDEIYRIDLTPPSKVAIALSFWNSGDKKSVSRIDTRVGKILTLRRVRSKNFFEYVCLTSLKGKYSLKEKYSFKVSIEPQVENFETEPNDTHKFANAVESDSTFVRGFITHRKDIDVYRLNFSNDSLFSIHMKNPPGMKTEVCLAKTSSRCWKSEGSVLKIEHQFVSKGTHFVEVKSLNGENSDMPYQIGFKSSLASRGDEKEPNNKSHQANVIRVNLPVKAYIHPAGDEDWYVFSMPGKLTDPPRAGITLIGGRNINPVISLYDAYGNLVLTDSKGIYTGRRNIVTPIHPGQRYFIKVSDKDGKGENSETPYELQLIKIEKPVHSKDFH